MSIEYPLLTRLTTFIGKEFFLICMYIVDILFMSSKIICGIKCKFDYNALYIRPHWKLVCIDIILLVKYA